MLRIICEKTEDTVNLAIDSINMQNLVDLSTCLAIGNISIETLTILAIDKFVLYI